MIFKPYGTIIALAVLAGVYWTRREVRQRPELDPEKVWEILPYVLIGGLAGARLYHVAHYWGYYSQDWWRVFQVWNGGLAIYGGLGGGLVGYFLYWWRGRRSGGDVQEPSATMFSPQTRQSLNGSLSSSEGVAEGGSAAGGVTTRVAAALSRLPSGPSSVSLAPPPSASFTVRALCWLDMAAPGIALGQAVGRLGNLLNNELLPFALYESIYDFLIFLFLAKFKVQSSKFKKVEGARFFTYLLLYALGRFFLEFLRTDNVWRWGMLTAAQGVSLGLIGLISLMGLIGWAGRARRRRKTPPIPQPVGLIRLGRNGFSSAGSGERRRGENTSC